MTAQSSFRRQDCAASTSAGTREFNLVKGAPERILPFCNRYFNEDGRICPLPGRLHLENKMKEMTERAVRVLALAVSDTPVSAAGDFSRLILVGLVGIRDEIRPEARAAVKQVCDAGIQAVLITGTIRKPPRQSQGKPD